MTVLLIFLAILVIVGIGLILWKNEDSKRINIGVSILFLSASVFGIFLVIAAPLPIHSTKFNLKKEIRVEIVDSIEVSRDTVYIFTSKK